MRNRLLMAVAAVGILATSTAFANSPFFDENGHYAGPLMHERAMPTRASASHAAGARTTKLPADPGYVATAPDSALEGDQAPAASADDYGTPEKTPPVFNHAQGTMGN